MVPSALRANKAFRVRLERKAHREIRVRKELKVSTEYKAQPAHRVLKVIKV
jgi:hypothetical protein